MGGVQSLIHTLIHSRLAEKFEFAVVPPGEAWRQLRRGAPRVFVFEDACAWRRLPELAAFRLGKGRSRIAIQENHYSEHFVRCRVSSLARFHAMLRLSYGLVDRVIAISQAQVEWMRARRLVAPHRLARVHLASPLAPLLALPWKTPARPRVLAAFGRFHPQKGFDVLLDALHRLPRRKVRLLIAGAGPDEASLRARGAGLDDVEFVGSRTDIPAFLAGCDAVVIPSRWEPLGLVCQEAKAAGKPVIAARVDGLTEQAEGSGLLVETENPDALAAAIAQLADMADDTLRAWGERGRTSVRDALETSLKSWEKLFEELAP